MSIRNTIVCSFEPSSCPLVNDVTRPSGPLALTLATSWPSSVIVANAPTGDVVERTATRVPLNVKDADAAALQAVVRD